MSKGTLMVFSAASGAGKSTILSKLSEIHPEIVYSISATTRAPRGTEKDGIDYFFLTKDEFEKKIGDGGFIEWAEVHGNYYGTPKSFVDETLEAGKIVVMDIDIQGKVQLDKIYSEAVGVFIETPSYEELERRLRSRGTDSEEQIAIRLDNAKKEQEFARFHGKYDYYIVNDDLTEAVQKIARIVELHM